MVVVYVVLVRRIVRTIGGAVLVGGQGDPRRCRNASGTSNYWHQASERYHGGSAWLT